MSPKSVALIAAAVAVMAMGVYLFIQVKSTPAQAHVSTTPSPSPGRIATAPMETTAPPATTTPAQARPPAPPPAKLGTPMPAPAMPAPAIAGPDDDERANPKLDAMMDLANKAYDSQDFDQAIQIAGKVLAREPGNIRMLRVMVSANCIGGDASVAQQYYLKLPAGSVDRQQMKTRCDKYQVTLND